MSNATKRVVLTGHASSGRMVCAPGSNPFVCSLTSLCHGRTAVRLPTLLARPYVLPISVVVVAGATFIISEVYRSSKAEPSSSDPRTMKEVIAIAEKLGLHYCSDQKGGTIAARLTISESPLTWERANALTLNPEDRSPWKGTLVVFRRDWEGLETMPDKQFEPWGEFFLYGDPSLIKRLTATTASE
jgi:hypothetical protein